MNDPIGQLLQDASTHHAAGRLRDAEALYRQILAHRPDHPDALHFLGVIALQCGRPDAAIELIGRALDLAPTNAVAWCNLGAALQRTGRFDEVVRALERVLALKPDYVPALNDCGVALKDRGRLPEALAYLQKAVALAPDLAAAHCNLGIVLLEMGRADEAKDALTRAITLNPNLAEAYAAMGRVQFGQFRLDAAIDAYRRALAVAPNFAEAHNQLAGTCMAEGNVTDAIASYRRAVELAPHAASVHSNLLLALNYQSPPDTAGAYAEAVRWRERHADPRAKHIRPHENDRTPGRRLRIGYASPDFRSHAVAFFIERLLARHNRNEVEVYCYAHLANEDQTTARLRAQADHWRPITHLTDEQACQLVRDDRIDILVDLAGHTAKNRLAIFAMSPAPVQVTYLGYPATTGLNTIGYRLTDAHADPEDSGYSERLVRLPKSFLCYTPLVETPPVAMPARRAVTFGCFNALPKINADVIEAWARILREVPQSRLLIKNSGFAFTRARKRVQQLFAEHGIGDDRLAIRLPTEDFLPHLAAYNDVDVALDTFPYNGTTTTCQAMWMGVPVVTLAGECHAGRVGVSLLRNVGVAELVTPTVEQYVALAVELARDAGWVEAYHAALRGRMQDSPLMDADLFAAAVEAAYRQMWSAWCRSA